jgi:pyruvate/2-oxoglutarate dehydrogenase complex dihydrolipoamide acyltransferase (E2) component
VAVDTDRGLLVPVIKDVNHKNITQIAVELQQLAEKARDRKLTVDEMSGGSMSLSNLGGIGGTYFTPIVNWPEWRFWACHAAVPSRSGRTASSCPGRCCPCPCRTTTD